jgi:quinoprotein glucose dehydrogenase
MAWGEDVSQNERGARRWAHGGGFHESTDWLAGCRAAVGRADTVNHNTGEIAWRVPFGRVDELEAKGVMNTGSFNKGGSVATGGGLVFIGASYDGRFHAYDPKSGTLLWETKLPAMAQVQPYHLHSKNGKQYVVVDAADTILAFALP